jgi:putative inorganic carbon (hco3(-)) transporter
VTTLRVRGPRRVRPREALPVVSAWLRDPRVPDWVRLAAAVAVLMPAVALLVVVGAGGHPGAYRALGAVLALAALAAALLRPVVVPIALTAIVMANAGMVIHDRADVPDILHAALALGAIALLAQPGGRTLLIRRTPVMVAALAFALVRWLSALLAPGSANSGSVLRDLAWGLVLIAVMTACAADRRALRWAARTLVVVAAALAVVTILKRLGLDGTFGGFAKDRSLDPEEIADLAGAPLPHGGRAAGPLGDPTLWAQALLLALPVAGWVAWDARGRRERAAWIGAAVLIVAGIAITQSKSAFMVLGLMAGLALWARGLRRVRIGLAALAAVAIGAGAFYVTSHYETVREIRTTPASEHEALRARLSENLAGLHMFQDHPLTGVGSGQFEDNYQTYATSIGLDDRFQRSAHNGYVQMAAESGALGVVTFVGMLVAALASAMRARRLLLALGRVGDARLAEALVIAVAGWGAMAAVLDFAFPTYLWLAMGLAAGMLLMAEAAIRRAGLTDVLRTAPVSTGALAAASHRGAPADAAPAEAPSRSWTRPRVTGRGLRRRRKPA